MAAAKDTVIPCWDGDPSTFETYCTACRWYERGTKQTERSLVVARLWGQLTGAAKSVVRFLDPDKYDGEQGLSRFLDVLRSSPLQNLPVPDSFTRLDRWSNLRRRDKESIAELIIREEELYVELQQSLLRARRDKPPERPAMSSVPESAPHMGQGPPSTPSRSPVAAARRPAGNEPTDETQEPVASAGTSMTTGFFEDELRGYRLLRASRISQQERQNVLVQTSNSTSFELIRRALRTLFAEDGSSSQQVHRPGRVWYSQWPDDEAYDELVQDDVYWSQWDDWNEWNDWTSPDASPSYWYGYEDDENWWPAQGDDAETWDEVPPDPESQDPAEVSFAEAYTLAGEANRTLKDAREAVRRVRQARGYYAPESLSGKGIVPSTSSPSSSKSTGKGKKGMGPCFRCGMTGHSYQQCPDRYAEMKGKSFQKGSKGFKGVKGKFKGSKSGKGKTFYVNLACVLSAQWDDGATNGRALTRAIIDTGASENAIGIDCLHDLVKAGHFGYEVHMNDLPTFRFGNGQRDKAVSRTDLVGTSLGKISFYVLGGLAKSTPPLIGARTLREKKVLLSYGDGQFCYSELGDGQQQHPKSVQMQALASGHLTIDLSEAPADAASTYAISLEARTPGEQRAEQSQCNHVHEPQINMLCCDVEVHGQCSHVHEPQIHMLSTTGMKMSNELDAQHLANLNERLQHLSEKLKDLRQGSHSLHGLQPLPGVSGRRSETQQLPMLWKPQSRQVAHQPVRSVDMLRKVRPETELWSSWRWPWYGPTDWSGSSPDSSGCPGVAADDSSRPMHRQDLQRQVAGVAGQENADWSDNDHGGEPRSPEVRGAHRECDIPGQSIPEDGLDVKGLGNTSHSCSNCPGPHHGCRGDPSVGASCTTSHQRGEEQIGESGDGERSSSSAGVDGKADGDGCPQQEPRADRAECGSADQDRRPAEGVGIHLNSKEGIAAAQAGCSPEDACPRGAGGSTQSCDSAERSRLRGRLTKLQEEIQGRPIQSLWSRLKQLKEKMSPMGRTASTMTVGHVDTTNPSSLESVPGSQVLEAQLRQPSETFDFSDKVGHVKHAAALNPIFSDQGQAAVKRHDEVDNTNSKKNMVMPPLAKKLAVSVAVLGAALTQPVQGLMAQISGAPDFVEIACADNSSLTARMEDYGFSCKRVNFKQGYDLSKPSGTSMLKTELKLHAPKFAWVSLPCTRFVSLAEPHRAQRRRVEQV